MSTGSTCARSTGSFIREGSQIGRFGAGITLNALWLATACATYTPAPIQPDSQRELFNARSLGDPALLAWFDSLGQPRPAAKWMPRQLAIAATWLRTDRAVRQAEIAVADAAVKTAGGRPQAGVSSDLEYAFSDPQASSRWGVALAGLFTIELGGKRGARIGRARAAALAARAAAAESEWEQVNEVYSALLAWNQADQLVISAREERMAHDSVVGLTQARFEGGTLTRLDVARSEGERRAAITAEQAAMRDASEALSGLAQVMGLPISAVGPAVTEGRAEPGWPDCDDGTPSRDSLQRTALGARWSVRRAAAEYQVAEGDLRVEVANAAPDLTLGPGVFFDQGTGKFTLGAGLPLALNRNRGPIGEAEARRTVAGARLMRAQEAVLSQVEGALASCDGARPQVVATDSLIAQAERRLSLTEAGYSRGELGRLEVMVTRLDVMRSRRAAREARLRQQQAGLALERALGAWGSRADGPWPLPAIPAQERRPE